jgi:hypothetical protein
VADSPREKITEEQALTFLGDLGQHLTHWQTAILVRALNDPQDYLNRIGRPHVRYAPIHHVSALIWARLRELRRARLSSMRSSYRSRMKARRRRG